MPEVECYLVADWRRERRHLLPERSGIPPVPPGFERNDSDTLDLGEPSGTPEALVVEVPVPPHDFPPVSTAPRGLAEDIGGRKVRPYTGTNRPPGILPEFWKMATSKEKRELIAEYEEACAREASLLVDSGGSSSSTSAAPAIRSSP
jgi:hypothetical protein